MSRNASSKGFPSQKSFDELLSTIPLFNQSTESSSSRTSPSFRTTDTIITASDPELCMGDDCDASYEAALLNSGILEWLNTDDSKSIFHHRHHQHSTSQNRLEMLLLHLTSTTNDQASVDNKKGKNKSL